MKGSSSAAFFHLFCLLEMLWFLLADCLHRRLSFLRWPHLTVQSGTDTTKVFGLFFCFWDCVLHVLCLSLLLLQSNAAWRSFSLSQRALTQASQHGSGAVAESRDGTWTAKQQCAAKQGERRSKACTMWSHITVWSSPKQGAHIFEFANKKIHNQTQSKRGLV